MQSLHALIRETRADDPIARALEALLDSGLIIFTRNTEGHFVQLSEVLSRRAGIIADVGTSQPRNLRVFDEAGRLLAGSEYPAAITRVTGTAQRDQVRRLVSDDGRQIWLKMSTLPMEQGPEGWSVLTVGADVTEFLEKIEAGRRELDARGALLELSLSLHEHPLVGEELVDAIKEPLAALVPGANVLIVTARGDGHVTTPIIHGYGDPVPVRRGRLTSTQRERWTADRPYVNLDVADTDIYGSQVIAELTNPIRSIVIAPCSTSDVTRLGALIAVSPQPSAFTEDQVRSLAIAGRMLAPGLASREPLARVS